MHVFFSFLVSTNYLLLVAMFDTIIIIKSVHMNLDLRHHVYQVLRAALALSEKLTGGFLTFGIHCLLELAGWLAGWLAGLMLLAIDLKRFGWR